MEIVPDRHDKTAIQKEISVVMKKAYCGFERLQKEHDARIRELLENLRGGRTGSRAA
jgi:hypothetical protein